MSDQWGDEFLFTTRAPDDLDLFFLKIKVRRRLNSQLTCLKHRWPYFVMSGCTEYWYFTRYLAFARFMGSPTAKLTYNTPDEYGVLNSEFPCSTSMFNASFLYFPQASFLEALLGQTTGGLRLLC